MRFSSMSEPKNWYPNQRYDGEDLDSDINEDYQKWYGVDPEKGVFEMTPEKQSELIESQKEVAIRDIGREGLGRFLNPPL